MATLSRGANAPLSAASLHVVLTWAEPHERHDIDLSALLLDSTGAVVSDEDFVFYNQPRHPSGAVTHAGREGTSERVRLDLESLPPGVETVVLAASIGDGTFGDVAELKLTVHNVSSGTDEHEFVDMGANQERALVVGEIYRRKGVWKLRAVGQGWDSGLQGLATNYGVRILQDTSAAEPAAAPPPTPALVPIAETPAPPRSEPEPTLIAYGRSAPVTPEAAAAEAAPGPGHAAAGAGEVPRRPTARRIVPATAPAGAGASAYGSSGVVLTSGQSAALSPTATPLSGDLTLRVSHGGAPGRTDIDLGVLTFDATGEPGDVLALSGGCTRQGGWALGGGPVKAHAEPTASVTVSAKSWSSEVAAIVLTASSYTGTSLSECISLYVEVLGADGAVVLRADRTAPDKSSALLVALCRADDGTCVIKTLDQAVDARTADSLIGTSRWALTA